MSDIADVLGGEVESVEFQSYQALPAGWYTVSVDEAEIKNTKAGTGKYLNIKFKVEQEQQNGRIVFARINILNPNSIAEEIGRRELGNLGSACGLKAVRDTTEFLGKMIQIKVVVDGEQNEVKGYRAIQAVTANVAVDSAPAPSSNPVSAKPPAAKPAGVKRPWEK